MIVVLGATSTFSSSSFSSSLLFSSSTSSSSAAVASNLSVPHTFGLDAIHTTPVARNTPRNITDGVVDDADDADDARAPAMDAPHARTWVKLSASARAKRPGCSGARATYTKTSTSPTSPSPSSSSVVTDDIIRGASMCVGC